MKNDFWAIPGEFIYRHHVAPRVKLYVPKEETFHVPLKYIDVTRSTHTDLDVLLKKKTDDYWNARFEQTFVRFLERIHKIHPAEREASFWIHVVREVTDRDSTTRPDYVWPLRFPLNYIDVTRTTHTSQDVLLEKHIEDYCNVDGEKELSDAWTGFTKFTQLKERPPEGYTWCGRRLTRKQLTYRPDDICPDMWKLCLMQRKRKQNKKGLSKNQRSTMPDNREECTSSNLMMKSSSP